MEEVIHQEQPKQQKKKTKWIIIAVAIVAILIAGIVSVQAFILTSAKEDYFLAEKNSIQQLQETFESRFQQEIAWKEHTDENAIESVTKITGQMNVPSMAGMGYDQIINNANITIESAMDKQENMSSVSISAGMAGIELNGIEATLDNNDLFVGLPFLDNIIQVNGDDLGRILQEIDPDTFTGEENIDFSTLYNENPFATEDFTYINEEYLMYLYDKLPDEAFESNSEDITVGDNSINAEKITFSLSEEEVQNILKGLFDKMAADEKLREILVNQTFYMDYANVEVANEEIAAFEEDFVSAMEDASANVDSIKLPDGFESIIWVHDDIIVKRELAATLEDAGATAAVRIDGTNAVTDNNQVLDYNFTVDDGNTEETMNINADLSQQDGSANDMITFSAQDASFTIESNQTEQNETDKSFEHIFSFSQQGTQLMSLHWVGEGTYEEDQMTVNHTLFAEDGAALNQDTLSISLSQEGSTISEVETPDAGQVKNLSDMSGEEITQYFETDVMQQFQLWMGNMMGGMGTGGF
ncbi:hypothetical protein MUN88_07860 [Gracilibacillus caseinilyticus]|uniref:Uncharacterized protein n=1 Tax=Gracilibacillus caseinilyticus TaxID=2932256 RepID=A0ABY4F0C1_9BACI|nr:DUF6583 family protein [Gracilibacillus caseinilyticus]UOQ49965.1 hypothetical protein MUN88_07860 [Gracilibacillus caseinilyticus]